VIGNKVLRTTNKVTLLNSFAIHVHSNDGKDSTEADHTWRSWFAA